VNACVASALELSREKRDELEDMAAEISKKDNLVLPTGRNPKPNVMRLTLDAFTSLPRPVKPTCTPLE
jgi:hypothetical protein